MIVLSQSGQIYRYLKRIHLDTPTDLCQLFWLVFLSMSLFVVLGVIAGSYIIGVFAWFLLPDHWTAGMSIILTFVVTLIGLVFLAFAGFDCAKQTTISNVVTEYYRGIKEKYCPLVTFKKDQQ